MKCPNCDKNMEEKNIKGFVIDYCKNCEGMFFGAGELALAKENLNDVTEFKDIKHGDNKKDHPKKTYICPVCKKEMKEIVYQYDSGIHIDICYQCNGIFLGANELFEINDYLDSMEKGQTERLYKANIILKNLEKKHKIKRKEERKELGKVKSIVYKLFRL